jgi:arsenate reductase-like glutaredoxin family protein
MAVSLYGIPERGSVKKACAWLAQQDIDSKLCIGFDAGAYLHLFGKK